MRDTLPNTSWSFDFLCISKALQSILSFIGLQQTTNNKQQTVKDKYVPKIFRHRHNQFIIIKLRQYE
jgi:hypothetical protein